MRLAPLLVVCLIATVCAATPDAIEPIDFDDGNWLHTLIKASLEAEKKASSPTPPAGADAWEFFLAVLKQSTDAGHAQLSALWYAVVPPLAQQPLRTVFQGFSSCIALGAGIPNFPLAPSEVTSATSLVDLFSSKSLVFLYYTIGSVLAELACFAILSPLAKKIPVRGSSMFNTNVGFVLLVGLAAVPSGIVDVSAAVAIVAGVATEGFVATLILGKMLRPYVVGVFLFLSSDIQFVQSLLRNRIFVRSAPIETAGTAYVNLVLSVAFWSAVVVAVALAAVSKLFGSDDEVIILEDD